MQRPEDLVRARKKGTPPSLYWLSGPADFLIERFVLDLARDLGCQLVRLSAKELRPHQVREQELVPDLFGTEKLFWIQDGEAWDAKARKKWFEELSQGGLSPGHTVALTQIAKRPSEAKLPSQVARAFFWNPFPNALPELAEGFLRELGAEIQPGVGSALIERYGKDLRRVHQEAVKLAASASERVTRDLVEDLCPRLEDSKAYEVAEVLTKGPRTVGLDQLLGYLDGDNALPLVFLTATRLRRLLWFKRAPKLGAAFREARDAAEELDAAQKRQARGGFGMKAPRRRALEGDVQALIDALPELARDDFERCFPSQAAQLLVESLGHRTPALRKALEALARADRSLKGEGFDPANSLLGVWHALHQGRGQG